MSQLSYNNRLCQAMPLLLGIMCCIPVAAATAQTEQLNTTIESETDEVVDSRQPVLPTNIALDDNVNREALTSYLLGPGDRLEMSVFGFPEYTGPLSVLPDGTVALPLVGNIVAAGKTTEQLEQELRVVLNRVLVDPAVSITLNSLRPVVINVAGEVHRPGPVQLQDVRNLNQNIVVAFAQPSVGEALVEAGGVRRTADIRRVTVIRRLPSGDTLSTEVNLWDALGSANLPEGMSLRDGDLVFVPRLAEGELVDSQLLARSSLAPDTVRVRVVGEVTRPGEVDVPPNSSLSSAVAIAGGPTEDAKLKSVAFIRMDETTGEVIQETVDLRDLVDTHQIQDGDVIAVPKKRSGSILDFAARVTNPLNFLFRIFDNN